MAAVKLLPAHANKDATRRFLREGQLAAKLGHPDIVPVPESSEHQGRPCFAMDRIEGTSLDPKLRNRKTGPIGR